MAKRKNEDKTKNALATAPQKPLNLYFNSETQKAIVAFQACKERKERDRLYVEEISPAFYKLVENLINIHKFVGHYDTFEELRNDCVNFLFETIHKFDAERGTNAFSYFNVVAKNWLIIKTKQKIQRTKKVLSIDDQNMMTCHERELIEENSVLPPQDILMEAAQGSQETLKVLYEIREKVKTENELLCINSIITIFENIDEVDLLNKNAILLYMRELSGFSPKQMTTAMHAIKKYYKKVKNDLNED